MDIQELFDVSNYFAYVIGKRLKELKSNIDEKIATLNSKMPILLSATLSSEQETTSTVFSDINGLSIQVQSNSIYKVDAFIIFKSSSTTTGAGIGFMSPTDCKCMLEVVVPIASTEATSALRTTFPNENDTNSGGVLGTGVTAVNSNYTARINGFIRTTSSGDFKIQFKSGVETSAITIQIGSEVQLLKVA